jgi:hypothetical protein
VKVLEIQSSPRGESSDSITLTRSFIEACKSDNDSMVVDTLNVWHESLPDFDYEAIGAKYKAVKHEPMTEAESMREVVIATFYPSPPRPTRFSCGTALAKKTWLNDACPVQLLEWLHVKTGLLHLDLLRMRTHCLRGAGFLRRSLVDCFEVARKFCG